MAAAQIRWRLLTMVQQELLTVPGIGSVSLDLRGWSQMTPDKFPAAFVLAGSFGAAEGEAFNQLRVEMPLLIPGYVRVAPTAAPDGIAAAREAFYAAVENAVLGDGLQTRLDADLALHDQEGATLIELVGLRGMDEGQEPPYGWFELEARAILHYTRGAL